MGLYMYVSEQDRISKREVLDKEMNELFQEALKFDPSLMIESFTDLIRVKRKWLGYKYKAEMKYSIYHESPSFNGTPYQARFQSSASGDKKIVTAYLHGIINGVNHHNEIAKRAVKLSKP